VGRLRPNATATEVHLPFPCAALISGEVSAGWTLLVSRLFVKLARCLALLALLAGSAAPAAFAMASVDPSQAHATINCDRNGHGSAPGRHLPGADACCMVNVCAMTLAIPATPSGVAAPAFLGTPGYNPRNLLQPAGITAAPIPHPPKPVA